VDIKLTSKGTKGEMVRAWIGPRRNVRYPVRVVQSGTRKGQILLAIPTRYAHLVEFGHRVVNAAGETIGYVAPKPFMRVAWGIAGGQVALATFTKVLQAEMDT
jgi:hypothetical protein